MNAHEDNVSIPSLEELKSLCDSKGIFLIELDYSSEFLEANPLPFFKIKLSVERYADYLNSQNISVMFYVYLFYEIDDFMIDEEILEAETLENEEVMQKIREYNNSLPENYDFARPKCFKAFTLIPNGKIGINIEDNWLENEECEYIIPTSEEALNNILYPTEEELQKHLDAEKEEQDKKRELFKKTFFEFLVNDNRFAICTTMKSRREYIFSLQQNEPELVKKLEELNGDWNPYKYEIFVEKTWKLIKQKVYEYSESIGQIL